MMELLAEFDLFLAEHIKLNANTGSGHTNDLSSTICEELINVMGKQVKDEIVSQLKKAISYMQYCYESGSHLHTTARVPAVQLFR